MIYTVLFFYDTILKVGGLMKTEILRKLQLEELTILDEVDRICKKHNIKYFLSYGTALGAVRHKGFIPWDDDIDVSMTMDNYLKFEEAAAKDLNPNFFFQSLKTEKHIFVTWNKIRKNNTLSTIKGQENLPIHLGICIDIFPLSKYPKDQKIQKKHYRYMKISLILLETELYKLKLKPVNKKGKLIYMILNIIPTNVRKKIANYLMNKVYKYEGEFEYYVDYQELYNKLILFPRNIIEELESIKFENKNYPIVKKKDEYLKIIYDDYMKLPPKEERSGHGNLAIKFNTMENSK